LAVTDILSFPFNSDATTGVDDRLYDDADFARYFAAFVGTGVYAKPSSGLQIVSRYGNMTLTALDGQAFINGFYLPSKGDIDFPPIVPPVGYSRIDAFFVTWDYTTRDIVVRHVQGVPSASPQRPALTRNSDMWDLMSAYVPVSPGQSVITQAQIYDTRLDPEVCGFVTGLIDQLDTRDIYAQYMAALAQAIAEWDAQKAQQQTGWENQMTDQQTAFDGQMTDIAAKQSEVQSWYDDARTDIAALQTFNFDNLAALPGAARTTVFNPDGSITEGIVKSGGGMVATRVTVFEPGGDIVETLTTYEEDGVAVRNTVAVRTSFPPSGEIVEGVTEL